MKKITTLLLLFCFVASYGQTEEEFKPSGSPFAKIFFNYHSDFDQESAFEINRAYFGYKYNLSKEFSADITLDVGAADVNIGDTLKGGTSLEMTAYLKTAGIAYKKGKLKVQAGLIGLQQFKEQENHWGHRYIYKSFQDQAKMGTSADLGVLVSYTFFDMLSADLTVRNGEGYKTLSVDKYLLTGLGVTLTPLKGLTLRGYYDYLKKDGEAQVTLAHFIGYEYEGLILGAEYNMQLNHKNTAGQDFSGLSAYASYDINDQVQVFGRYDQLASDQDWNISKDGSYLILGVQYSPVKKIQIALNYQGDMPAESGSEMSHMAYVNCQFAF